MEPTSPTSTLAAAAAPLPATASSEKPYAPRLTRWDYKLLKLAEHKINTTISKSLEFERLNRVRMTHAAWHRILIRHSIAYGKNCNHFEANNTEELIPNSARLINRHGVSCKETAAAYCTAQIHAIFEKEKANLSLQKYKADLSLIPHISDAQHKENARLQDRLSKLKELPLLSFSSNARFYDLATGFARNNNEEEAFYTANAIPAPTQYFTSVLSALKKACREDIRTILVTHLNKITPPEASSPDESIPLQRARRGLLTKLVLDTGRNLRHAHDLRISRETLIRAIYK